MLPVRARSGNLFPILAECLDRVRYSFEPFGVELGERLGMDLVDE
jgi:hypothetical protein